MKRRKKLASLLALVVVSGVLVMLCGCIVPDNAYLMELNRNGKWREAERVGQGMLAHGSTFSHSQVCETYFHVVYAQTRMGKTKEATRVVTEYDAFRAEAETDPEPPWLGREMARLKDELGLFAEPAHALVSAMEENRKGSYTRARELCDSVLAMKDVNNVQRATAHFVAAVCSIRLKDVESAEAHLAAFDTLKPALPSGHQALSEESQARQGLRELKELLRK